MNPTGLIAKSFALLALVWVLAMAVAGCQSPHHEQPATSGTYYDGPLVDPGTTNQIPPPAWDGAE